MNYLRPTIIGLLALAALLALFAQGQPAHAATITVNTNADEFDTGSGCSLREAIQAANTNAAFGGCTAGSGADTIDLPAGTYTLTIAGAGENANATGDLDITENLTINGSGATTTIVQACDSSGGPCTGIDRVIHVSGTSVISGLTIQNGSPPPSPPTSAFGGGIFNQGSTLTLTNCTVSGNAVSNAFGGGIAQIGGAVNLTNCTVSNNSGSAHGGGISNGSGSLILTNSTVSGNSIFNPSGEQTAGGILSSGTVTLTNSTVSGNSAPNNSSSSGIRNVGGTMTLKNTIVSNNTPNDCAGSITSAGHNLDSDGSCGLSVGLGDIISTDPLLGPLADNGGPTFTHALLANSPAIDAGNPATPGSGGNACEASDQRGVTRPLDGDGDGVAICDIGAFEVDCPAATAAILEYRFEEGSGTTVCNSGSFAGANGTLQDGIVVGAGPIFSADTPPGVESSRSLEFDGINDFVRIPDQFDYTVDGTPSGTPLNQLTVEAWIKPDTLFTQFPQKVIWDDFGNPGVALIILEDGRVEWIISTATDPGLGIRLAAGKVVFDPDQWQHVAGIYDGTQLRIFINGQDTCASVATSGGIQDNSTVHPPNLAPIGIGADNVSIGFLGFDGRIDELRVFPVALDRTELARGFFANVSAIPCPGGDCPPLVADADGDGIEDLIDRSMDGLTDEVFNPFNDTFNDTVNGGMTFGIIENRSGVGVCITDLPFPDGVQATISGSDGAPGVLIDTCGPDPLDHTDPFFSWERTRLDVAGETANITCVSPGSGCPLSASPPCTKVTAVTAIGTIPGAMTCGGPRIELLKSVGFFFLRACLSTNQFATAGSAITAGANNVGPILVEIVNVNDIPFGSFQLAPGQAADVDFPTDTTVTVTNLGPGPLTVTVGDVTAVLSPGESQTFDIPIHDIEILKVTGNTKTKELQSKGYSVKLQNNGPVPEVIPVAVAVLPLTGCPTVGIDVTDVLGTGPPDGLVTAADGNIITDVNGDTIPDTLAFTASGVVLPGGPDGVANFNVLYGDCPGLAPPGPAPQTVDTTIADYVILADACHLGDNTALAPLFGGAPCGGAGAPQDGGIDLLFGNDGPVTRIVNVTDYLRIPCNPVICP